MLRLRSWQSLTLLVTLLVAAVDASVGDRLPEFKSCVAVRSTKKRKTREATTDCDQDCTDANCGNRGVNIREG